MRREMVLSCQAASVLIIVLLILSIVLSPGKAVAGVEVGDFALQVQVNGREVVFPDARPFIDENGRVQVPVRFVAQALGAKVSWDADTALITGYGKEIVLTAGGSTATVNDTVVTLDSGAVLIAGRIYVPARFIAETLGAGVQWDADTRTAKITMDKPLIKNFGISHTKFDAGWYTIPRTFSAWVECDNAQKVDFYLEPTGFGQEPVKIATSSGKDGCFSITYRLPQESTLAHFWVVAVNERGEQSTDILNVYTGKQWRVQMGESIDFGELSLNGYNHDLLFAPGGGRAVFGGYSYPQNETWGQTENPSGMLLLLDIPQESVTVLDEGSFLRALAWDAGGENVLYMKDGSLVRLSLKDGEKIAIAENSYYGTFSPDGKKIAYIQQKNGLWICDIDGNNKKKLTETSDDWYPVWYPDGRRLFFFNDLGIELGDGAGYLQGMAAISIADGTIEHILPQKTGKFRSAEWIVPGRSLHVVSGWDDGFFHHIVDLAGGKIIDLGENFGNMNFVTGVDTAGGRLLKAGAGGMIQIYDASGNMLKSFNLAHMCSCRQYLNATFAPDGRKVLTMRGTQTWGEETVERIIEVVDIENESAVSLAAGSENYEAAIWDPGSGQVLILERELNGAAHNLTSFTMIQASGIEKPKEVAPVLFVPVIKSALSNEEKVFIEEVKWTKGVYRHNDLYVIALGAQPNPGYGLEIAKTEMNGGQATFYIKLTKPEPGKMYASVISYPYLAGNINLPENTIIRFVIEETGEVLNVLPIF